MLVTGVVHEAGTWVSILIHQWTIVECRCRSKSSRGHSCQVVSGNAFTHTHSTQHKQVEDADHWNTSSKQWRCKKWINQSIKNKKKTSQTSTADRLVPPFRQHKPRLKGRVERRQIHCGDMCSIYGSEIAINRALHQLITNTPRYHLCSTDLTFNSLNLKC